ncbi:MAG: AAA family ATPase [Candidatus Delongbacteria bacterium]|jgi:predicted AAA+ superfamily ATPase|nr:AAA family ATPase [Candidatus Delongbacteria bacterium]
MIRSNEKSLKDWLNSYGRKPVIIRGARQVGKSTLVRMFAKNEGLDLVEINLEKYLFMNEIFKTFDIPVILRELEGIAGKTFNEKSLLFLDEIQAVPNALACLRYFYEERKELPVISAGSLLEFTLSEHSYSMPVGRVDYRYLGPMSFNEFIYNLYPELKKYISSINEVKNMPDTIHKKLTEKFKEYLFIGGMPEAVLAYKETGSLESVKTVHRSICDTYLDDFAKYGKKSKELLLLQKLFRAIPQNIGDKVKYTNLSKEHKSVEVKSAVEMLIKARICNPVYGSDCSGIPLKATENREVYKLMFLDVGLVNHITGLDINNINSLDADSLINKGRIAEQFVSQHLINSEDMTRPSDLNYWLRENKKGNAELDFVEEIGGKIVPLEVKSGKSGTLKSLHQFVALKKDIKYAVRFDLNKYSSQTVRQKVITERREETEVEYILESYPVYAAGLLT